MAEFHFALESNEQNLARTRIPVSVDVSTSCGASSLTNNQKYDEYLTRGAESLT